MKYQIYALSLLALGIFLASPVLVNAQQKDSLEGKILTANDELFHKGNLNFADEIFASNYVSHGPDGPKEVGPKGIKKFVKAMRTAFPDLRVEIEVLVQEDNTIAWLRTHRGTFKSDYLGIKATGKVVTWRSMAVSRYEDGQIAEEWGVGDFVEAASRTE